MHYRPPVDSQSDTFRLIVVRNRNANSMKTDGNRDLSRNSLAFLPIQWHSHLITIIRRTTTQRVPLDGSTRGRLCSFSSVGEFITFSDCDKFDNFSGRGKVSQSAGTAWKSRQLVRPPSYTWWLCNNRRERCCQSGDARKEGVGDTKLIY